MDAVVVACHNLRKETTSLLGGTICRLLSTSALSILGVRATSHVIVAYFVHTVGADVVHAELAICLVGEHAGHVRLELVSAIVTIRLLDHRLQLIVLLPQLNVLLLCRLIKEVVSKNGRQRVEIDHVGVLHLRVVQLSIDLLHDLVMLHLIKRHLLALKDLRLGILELVLKYSPASVRPQIGDQCSFGSFSLKAGVRGILAEDAAHFALHQAVLLHLLFVDFVPELLRSLFHDERSTPIQREQSLTRLE